MLHTLILAACSMQEPEKPALLSVEPTEITNDTAQTITLKGKNFHSKLKVDFDNPGASEISDTFMVQLINTDETVQLVGVLLIDESTIQATVPAGTLALLYDVKLSDPRGRTVELAEALRVYALACSENTECKSGFCTDGICCESACGEICEACNLEGYEGDCRQIEDAEDPENECEDSGACIRNCDGKGACTPEKCLPDGLACQGEDVCMSGHCTDGVCCASLCQGPCETCSLDGSLGLCTGFILDSDPEEECSDPADCEGVCDGKGGSGEGLCLTRHCADGTGCDGMEEASCESGTCEDGVCCDQPCEGLCYSCNLEGSSGSCMAIPSGSDPDMECADLGQCTSLCDGNGACDILCKPKGEYCLTAEECATANCVDGRCCDKACAGSCEACDLADAEGTCTAIANNEDPEEECADPEGCQGICDGNGGSGGGACLIRHCTDGTACNNSDAAICDSGFCADGVCCDLACNGVCEACNIENAIGHCVGFADDSDPGDECNDPQGCEAVCDGNGGTGVGACVVRHCVNGTGCTEDIPEACESGNCVDERCCNLTCDGPCEACDLLLREGTCSGIAKGLDPDNECYSIPGCQSVCDGNGGSGAGSCMLENCQNGTACSADQAGICTSGKCVDGYCCNKACDGTCEACDLETSLGVCSGYDYDSDPEGECPQTITCLGVCDGNGGDGSGSCLVRHCDSGTACTLDNSEICETGDCVDGYCCNEPCSGICQACDFPSQEGQCLYVDNGDDLQNECEDIDACVSTCDGEGHCAPVCRLQGEACESEDECATGFCVDDVCCNQMCNGICKACNTEGSVGICTGYNEDTDPEDECHDPAGCLGVCNGEVGSSDGACLIRHCEEGADCKNHGSVSCESGSCVDEVCCNNTCDGLCERCDIEDNKGKCTGIGVGSDPDSECLDPVGCDNVCNGLGGDGAGGCMLENCLDGFDCSAHDASICQSGNCMDGYCCNNSCDGVCESCGILGERGTCTGYNGSTDPDEECPDRTGCSGLCDGLGGENSGACLTQDCDDGIDCSVDGSAICFSGYCVDDVCCNSGCDKLCHSCSLPQSEGLCSPILSGDDPESECPDDLCTSTCDGAGNCQPVCICVRYVDLDAPAGGNGQSWATAFKDIKSAMLSADSQVTVDGRCEIWVKAGKYYIYLIDRKDTLQLLANVEIYGGFAGYETARSQRDWQVNVTEISGKDSVAGSNKVNHVVTGADDAVIDGFTIRNGFADSEDRGGGIYNLSTSPIIRNCLFEDNFAKHSGGAIANLDGSNPTIENCRFDNNKTNDHDGGAISNEDSSAVITNSYFIGNSAQEGGGAIYNKSSSPHIKECVFVNNSAEKQGGAIANLEKSYPEMANLTFARNSAIEDGGAIYDENGCALSMLDIIFTGNEAGRDGGAWFNKSCELHASALNIIFSGNSSLQEGGALYLDDAKGGLDLSNVIFLGNIAGTKGGAIYAKNNATIISLFNATFTRNLEYDGLGGGAVHIENNADFDIVNSILYYNYTEDVLGDLVLGEIYSNSPNLTITYSDIRDGHTGEGNIDADPDFYEWHHYSDDWESLDVDSDEYQTILIDEDAQWTPDQWKGMFVQPNTFTWRYFPIVGNTEKSLRVWGKVADVVSVTDIFRIVDVRLSDKSECIDAGNGDLGPDTDLAGEERVDIEGVDNTGIGDPPYVDMGAYERQP